MTSAGSSRRCQHGVEPSNQPSRRRWQARNARTTRSSARHQRTLPSGHLITSRPTAVHRVVQGAVLAGQVGYAVQLVRPRHAV
jgi:hypothetical protein